MLRLNITEIRLRFQNCQCLVSSLLISLNNLYRVLRLYTPVETSKGFFIDFAPFFKKKGANKHYFYAFETHKQIFLNNLSDLNELKKTKNNGNHKIIILIINKG